MKVNGMYKAVDTDYLYYSRSGGLLIESSFSTNGWNPEAIWLPLHVKI